MSSIASSRVSATATQPGDLSLTATEVYFAERNDKSVRKVAGPPAVRYVPDRSTVHGTTPSPPLMPLQHPGRTR